MVFYRLLLKLLLISAVEVGDWKWIGIITLLIKRLKWFQLIAIHGMNQSILSLNLVIVIKFYNIF